MTQSSRVLATRCPHCHTVFRVVADQLKLRDGLVRCGHCREVFDGRAYLCDPPAEEQEAPANPDLVAPPDTAAHGSQPGVSNTTPAPSAGTAAGGDKPIPEMLTPTAIAALLGTPDESRAQMQHGPGRYMDDVDDDPTVLSAPTATPSRIETSSPDRSEAQRHPGAARAIWRVLMALAVIGLLGQWAWIERAALVDRVPALRGVFAAIGQPLHVTIGLPRVPDQIQISSVTLVTDTAGAAESVGAADSGDASASAVEATASDAVAAPDALAPTDAVPMTLTVFVRNQADYALAWPSLELTLSDLDGKPVVRRVFSANEYVAGASMREAGLAPRSERTIRLRLSAQAALASNYRVLAFYP
ncbi:hypothetical protein UC34_21520 [Pandoraea vervacti]|uniref:Zinc finger/thioredoxin putative domain-containing protein n=1 Tax=Pandoraea vervacti TaxID=656178 RepID=A0ABN4FSU1_9BURK|nr:DUF3426 domain-containing protein [Pandoraea vervacti]AJP58818.1 hypothetical protein UC34_21520 [Pandoraea vervacti]